MTPTTPDRQPQAPTPSTAQPRYIINTRNTRTTRHKAPTQAPAADRQTSGNVESQSTPRDIDKDLQAQAQRVKLELCKWFLSSLTITPPSAKSTDQVNIMRAGLNFFALVGNRLEGIAACGDVKLEALLAQLHAHQPGTADNRDSAPPIDETPII